MLPAVSLRWRMRRGMRELDVVLQRYFDTRYRTASEGERRTFEALLGREDPEIWEWLLGHGAAPPEFTDVIRHLRGDR